MDEAASAGLHADTESPQVLITRCTEFVAAAGGCDHIPARCRQFTGVGGETLDEAASATLHADTKSMQVLITRYA